MPSEFQKVKRKLQGAVISFQGTLSFLISLCDGPGLITRE